jgi:Flp pilus assembly protein TadG
MVVRNCRPRHGAAAAELAIVLPLLTLVFLVALDFCRAYYCTQTVQAAANSAAMYASGTALPAANTTAEDAARQAAVAEGTSLRPPLTTDNVAVSVANGMATVTVTYEFHALFGGGIVPGQINVVRTVTMSVAPAPPGGW